MNVTVDESGQVAEHLLRKPPARMDHKLNVDFGGKVELLGYDLVSSSITAGTPVLVTWYWRCKEAPGSGWRLFTHVLDAKGTSRINQDNVGPIRDHFQPEHWKPGMIVRDPQRIEVPASWSSDFLELRVGLWNKENRMQIRSGPADKANRAKGPRITTGRANPMLVRVPWAKDIPVIDGHIELDAAWRNAASLIRFSRTITGEAAERATDVRLMWTKERLFVAVWAEDDNLQSKFKTHDDELWREDAFEIFLDPQGDQKNYYEIQVSPAGVVFDSYLPSYRKNHNEWSSGVEVKVSTRGTLNDDADVDTGWTAELAIPFASLRAGQGDSPSPGDKWRVNFFRIDVTKKKPLYSAWSPPLRGDFHALNAFGELVFLSPQGGPMQDSDRGVSN